jgi:predicted secreted protein
MQTLEAPRYVLKVSNGLVPPSFLTVEGVRLTRLDIVSEGVELGPNLDEGWRKMLSGGGLRQVTVSAEGLLLGSPADARLRQLAWSADTAAYEIGLEDSREVQGAFVVQQLTLEGLHGEEATYRLQLKSSGPVALV